MTDALTRLNAALEGRYRIQRELGRGGMATVYLADDLRHGRLVALKVLRAELAAVLGAERFLAEIRTTASLQHPHILPLHDSGEAAGLLFYVMPFVQGESLRARLDRERQLPVDEATRIALEVAEALDYAHRQGVLHRDIKPDNVLFQEGKPVVADFGIALALGAAGQVRLTETGLSLGTPGYMSPEQASGDTAVGPASDIYALGCMLYEMLAGEPPFTGRTPQAILGKIVTVEPERVSRHRSTVPPNVDAAIAKALSKLPADRFTRADDFARALRDPTFHLPLRAASAAGAPRIARRRRWPFAAAIVLALAAGALGAMLALPDQPGAPLARFTVSPLPGPLAGICCGPVVALSPDGQWLAWVVGGAAAAGPVYRRALGRLDVEPIPGTDGATIPFFSPDGEWLGFHASGRLLKVPMAGGSPVPIVSTEPGGPYGASWGDDDTIVFAASDGLHTVPASGGVARRVPGTEGMYHPWMLPGGSAAIARTGLSPSEDRIAIVELETGTVDTLVFGTRGLYAMGHLLVTSGDGTVAAYPFDVEARRIIGSSVVVIRDVALSGPAALGEVSVSANGGLAYEAGGHATRQSLIIVRPDGEEAVDLPSRADVEEPAFSPDGRRLALRLSDPAGASDIWLFDRLAGTLERFTDGRVPSSTPVWSADGAFIAFSSARDGGLSQIYSQPVDGAAPGLLLSTAFPAYPASFSRDGRTLAMVGRRRGTRLDIGLLMVGASAPRWIAASEADELHPQISPDGRWLAYASNRDGRLDVYVEPLDGGGGRVKISLDGGHSPRWAPDGSALYYAATASLDGSLVRAEVAMGESFSVVARAEVLELDDLNTGEGSSDASINYDVGPDGREIAHVRIDGTMERELVWILNWLELVRDVGRSR